MKPLLLSVTLIVGAGCHHGGQTVRENTERQRAEAASQRYWAIQAAQQSAAANAKQP